MSNLETTQAIYQAFGQGDVPTILSHLAEDVAWEAWADNSAQNAGVPLMQPRTGRAGAADFFQAASAFEIIDFQVLDFAVSANQVIAEVVIELKSPVTGRSYRDEELHLWTFDADGLVCRLRHYTDTAKHIAATTDAGGAR